MVRWSLVSEFGRGKLRTSWTVGKGTGNSKNTNGILEIHNCTILNMQAFEKACDAGARTVQGNGVATLVLMQLQCAWIVLIHTVACIASMGSTLQILQHITLHQHIQLAGQASPPKLSIKSRIVGDVYHCSTHQIKGNLLLLCGHVLLDLSTHQSSQSSPKGSNHLCHSPNH